MATGLIHGYAIRGAIYPCFYSRDGSHTEDIEEAQIFDSMVGAIQAAKSDTLRGKTVEIVRVREKRVPQLIVEVL